MRRTSASTGNSTKEHDRLLEHRLGKRDWKRWGPYLAERSWGTVREDYSADGEAWNFLTHDMSRSKAYRWGEDGLAGLCDESQTLCFSPALWNGADPILKERLFGLSGPEGNHGEDVKELYYYLDCTPTHSYMKYLYKYPHGEFPYNKLVDASLGRGTLDPEYELIDTGIFNESRYFDVTVEYAKAGAEEILVRITAANRGPEEALLHVLPQVWFRNTWAWREVRDKEPVITEVVRDGDGKAEGRGDGDGAPAAKGEGKGDGKGDGKVNGKGDGKGEKARKPRFFELVCRHEKFGERYLYAECENCEGGVQSQPDVLFTDNETNSARLYGVQNIKAYVKDAFHEYLVREHTQVINPRCKGTKAAIHYTFLIPPGESRTVRLILSDKPAADKPGARPFAGFDATFARRVEEAEEFYESIHPRNLTVEEKRVQRQAFAGMLWTKQFYPYDVRAWLYGDKPTSPPSKKRLKGRNKNWADLSIEAVMSMPDKWEYPWFAAWDLAFHVIPLAMVDVDFAKEQIELIVGEKLMHANGQVPAYEWEFSDVNPPVQAWAVWRVYNIEKHANGEAGDRAFLERCFHKLLLNFTWWVNRKDSTDRNIFQGGFLGLDNISVFDRSKPLPGGGLLEQADATGWMGLFCLNLMAIGLELAQEDQVYEHLGIKFFEHFMAIAAAINSEILPGVTLWNEEDGWYYDVVHGMDGRRENTRQLTVRSQVGLIPLFAAQVLEHTWFEKLPNFKARYEWLLMHRPELSLGMACVWTRDGVQCLLSIVNHDRMHRILRRTLDESEFLSPHGLRSLSRYHLDHPYQLTAGGQEWTVHYEPAESTTKVFGGNSNWRGPVWFPTAFMLVTALRVYDRFYAAGFQIECPTGSGKMMTLNEVAMELNRRMCALFLPDASGRRPIHGGHELLQSDPHFKDHLLFHEFFHGDTGAGLGASHQTGWTGLVAKMLEQVAADRKRSEAGKKVSDDAQAVTNS